MQAIADLVGCLGRAETLVPENPLVRALNEAAPGCIPEVLELFDHSRRSIRRVAAKALSGVEAAECSLVSALESPHMRIRCTAVNALVDRGPTAGIRSGLHELLRRNTPEQRPRKRSPKILARSGAAAVLARFGQFYPEFLPEFDAQLNETERLSMEMLFPMAAAIAQGGEVVVPLLLGAFARGPWAREKMLHVAAAMAPRVPVSVIPSIEAIARKEVVSLTSGTERLARSILERHRERCLG